VYPAIAQNAGVTGAVIIEATIGADGRVIDAKVLRSIPLLDQAALDAVRQWEYKPTLLNGVAVPVIMTVTITSSGRTRLSPRHRPGQACGGRRQCEARPAVVRTVGVAVAMIVTALRQCAM